MFVLLHVYAIHKTIIIKKLCFMKCYKYTIYIYITIIIRFFNLFNIVQKNSFGTKLVSDSVSADQ